ncbi:hypothetical protein GCM10010297_14890 [Streptomyces malachitofuscus]|nr:hypothetical protein GCM10010297_14890 [Streptomyces malachitofuscus]
MEDEAEGRSRPDQQCLGGRPCRQPQQPGAAHGVGKQDEDGGDAARGDGPQSADGIRLAERDVLHGDAGAGQEPVRRLCPYGCRRRTPITARAR